MIYGYARVSSVGQERDGNGLDVQVGQLTQNGAQEVVSEAFTGTKMDRPEWQSLLARLQPGDTIMVCKLDRIARKLEEGYGTVRDLLERGVNVHILNMGRIDNTPTGRLILGIMFSFAEFERDMIWERTQAGKAYKRETDPDYREGRKRIDVGADELLAMLQDEESGRITGAEAAERLGISRSTYQRRKRELRSA